MWYKRCTGLRSFVVFFVILFTLFVSVAFQVSADHDGQCTKLIGPSQSIQETISEVQTGSTICLEEGTWKEQIKIKKSVTLRGSGEETKIHPEHYDSGISEYTISVKEAGSVKLQNLHVSFEGDYGGAVVSQETTLKVQNCKFSSDGIIHDLGLAFNGAGGNDPKSLDLKISDSDFVNCGIKINSFDKPVKGVIEKSTISNSTKFGIYIGNGGTPPGVVYSGPKLHIAIKNSLIKGNGEEEVGFEGSGVTLGNGAEARIINSSITDNKLDGVFVWQSAEATVLNSELSNNNRNGISLWDLSRIRISNSRISSNGGSGVTFPSWSMYSDEELKGNVIYNADYLPSNIYAKINNNVLANNEDYGVMIYTNKCPVNHLKPRGMEVIGFWGRITGSSNSLQGNSRKSFCPSELSFLQSEEGGRYPRLK